ncbi:MAG: catalase [Kofleriaceae bacterium]|nr:catalase [Kofleriaceae bacterium]
MPDPSTAWRERVADDEEARFGRYGEQLAELQRRAAARHGPGRALHRKQHLGLRATVEVLPELPAHARHGLFATPGPHEAQLRLSNGSGERAPDRRPDIRGFALRVLGVDGDGALGGPATAQCFVLINSEAFAFPTVDDFMGVVVAAARSPFAVLRHLQRRHGFFGGLGKARALGKALGKPFGGFAHEPFYSAAPIACGPYAAKVRLWPTSGDAPPPPSKRDWSADVVARLGHGALTWDLQLQFFVDEATTPIEDPTVAWPAAVAPFVTVARVTAPAQDPASDDGRAVAAAAEAGVFDPWQALAAHRPLGEIMRARKVAYFASQQGRGAA